MKWLKFKILSNLLQMLYTDLKHLKGTMYCKQKMTNRLTVGYNSSDVNTTF